MTTLIAFPVLGLLVMFQTAIVSRVYLLHGSADLVMLAIIAWAIQARVQNAWQWSIIGGLMVSLVTALPFGILLASYLSATGVTLLLRRRIWQIPILAMFVATFIGTIIIQGLSILVIWLSGTPLPIVQSMNLITLPSLLLNVLLAIPVYILIGDLANWVYPKEIEA
jgi:hypothetical protein